MREYNVDMEGILFVIAFSIVALIAWYFLDDDMYHIRRARKESEREAIAKGEMDPPPTFKEVAMFGLGLVLMFGFIIWLGVS